jgi:hypothetical protein
MVSWAARICPAAAFTDAWDPRSRLASGDSARIVSTARFAFSWLRTAMTTCAPLPTSTLAVCRPRPPFAPVTTVVRPVRSGTESRV